MANGWTGGQYSVYRALLAAGIAWTFGPPALVIAAPLALGIGDRIAAQSLVVFFAFYLLFGVRPPSSAATIASLLALLHGATPSAPYGSWAARRRADPAGGWSLPAWLHLGAQALLVVCALLVAGGKMESPGALWVPLCVLAFDPAWLPPKREGAPARLFYDGDCGLCHAAVRFVLAEDRAGLAFRFAPLASESFARVAPIEIRATLPDSIVVVLQDGTLLVRSAAALEIGERLGGLWRVLARLVGLLPAAQLDRLYDAIARNRKRLARKPEDSCPVVSPELRARFD